jgi:hypothetical protein
MTFLKELRGDLLVDALTFHQKVVTHPLGLIFFWRFKENIRFRFTRRLSTIIILVGIVYSSNKKTIGIPREGDAYFMVFFSVLANENWKVAF